ncbi:hypothetical protein QVN91_04225 [Bacteroides caecigallinarum]|uniref:phage/plasmid replication domain-containing protein n=1 Tax=uncultured Bacteroides sp. TaxID=162156 RepID=UPI002594FDD0|nr:phage/plasmid replication protein [uncultured Bacteroides sp.]MDN0052182.1 hypothetical protein [Bacteroides caecigallinarum]
MFDTVHFHVGDGITDFTQLAKYLPNVKYKVDKYGNILFSNDFIDNLYIELHNGWMICQNSLPKFLLGNNVERINLQQVKEAIEKLSDMLHYDMSKTFVTRIDIADNFSMSENVSKYFSCLGNLQRFKRCYTVIDETLTYKQGDKKCGKLITFYDKRKELIEKGQYALFEQMKIPKNFLRYELRCYGRLAYQLKETAITGATLYDTTFFRKLVQLWYDYYCRIVKQQEITFNNINLIKDNNEALYCALKAAFILQPAIFADYIIEIFKSHNIFRSKSEYTRLKKGLYDILNDPLMTRDSKLIMELDSKVLQTYNEMMG